MHRAPSGPCHGCAPAASPAPPAGSPHRAHRGGDSYCRGVGALGVMVPVWSWLDNICTTLAYGALPCCYPPLMRLRGFPSACRALAEELVPSSRVRETALARSSSIPSVVCWLWRCWLHTARLSSVTHRASGGPHVWYISTCRTPPLILSVVPGWLALARAATSFRPAGGRRVLCGMRAPCACVHQRTIAQVCRAFCAILAQNVGIVRKTCRAEGKTCHKRVAFGSDVQGRLVLRRSSSQVVVEELHGTDRVRELLGKQQRLAYQA